MPPPAEGVAFGGDAGGLVGLKPQPQRGAGEKRVEALRLSDAFRARVIDTTHNSFVFEVTGAPDKIDAFIGLMRPLGLVDVSRTGVVAIARGPEAM